MKVVAVSDTHELEQQLDLPEADMLIHCGDLTYKGSWSAYMKCLNWFQDQQKKFKHIICICGNHDFNHKEFASMLKDIGVIYLENSGATIEGIRFYGCPNVSNLPKWNFNDDKDPTCWDRIPDDVEVLITHSPPIDFLDEIWHYGSSKLRKRVDDLMEKKLKVNVFGHCHADGGKQMILKNKEGRDVRFVNCAICSVDYKAVNPPILIDI